MGQRLKRKKLLVALGISVILTVASLAIIRPLKDPNACYVTLCHNGTATIALQRGFPLTIAQHPAPGFEPGDVDNDTEPAIHPLSAVGDVLIFFGITYAFLYIFSKEQKRSQSKDSLRPWPFSGTEPTTWTTSTADTNLTAGYAGVGIANNGTGNVTYTSFAAKQP